QVLEVGPCVFSTANSPARFVPLGQVMEPDRLEALQRRGEVIDGYVLGELLGVGGMGVVYAATQQSLDRTVAVKLPLPEHASDPAVRQRFRTEAYTSARVNHRNIVDRKSTR